MCSRFLPLAAIAAMVACGSNQAAASGEGEGSGIIGIAEYLSAGTDGSATAPVTVTENDGNFAMDSRYYKTTLEWNDGKVSFTDMHLSAAGHAVTDLPIMEGTYWSSPERKAGIYFMESIPGVGLNIIKCKDPVMNTDGGHSIRWDDRYGDRSFRMEIDGESITIEGYDPATGEPVGNWFLSLITAREKGGELPFTVIVPQRVNSIHKGQEYHLATGPGIVALNRDDTPPVFNIYPEDGKITLIFDGR